MAKYSLKLPSMGESVTEATLTAWLKEVGDTIEIDDSVVEVSTDKVDSDVPSEVEGVLLEKRFELNQVIQVGEVIAVIETDQEIEEALVTPEIAVVVEKFFAPFAAVLLVTRYSKTTTLLSDNARPTIPSPK